MTAIPITPGSPQRPRRGVLLAVAVMTSVLRGGDGCIPANRNG